MDNIQFWNRFHIERTESFSNELFPLSRYPKRSFIEASFCVLQLKRIIDSMKHFPADSFLYPKIQ